MPPRNPLTGWEALYEERRAVHYRAEDGWIVLHLFGVVASGGLDLVGFRVEPCDIDEPDALADHVLEIVRRWSVGSTPRPLTSRRLRISSASGTSLTAARAQLPVMAAMLDEFTATAATAAPQLRSLARMVLRYEELLLAPGARAALAREEGVSEDAIKSRLRDARLHGLWLTAGPGKPGQPSPLARRIAQQETNP